MSDLRLQTDVLLQAGRLLLEYNESAAAIHHALTATAKTLRNAPCHVVIAYGSVAVSFAGESPALETVNELHYNLAVQARVHEILEQLRAGRVNVAVALASLQAAEMTTPRHPRWLVALGLGVAAASLSSLLGADVGAMAVAGMATGIGLLVRQELGRRGFSPLTLPLTGAFIGAIFGGLAIQRGWTRTPELVLVVPALMLIPGPHLLNGLLDLIDNYLPLSVARLGLALGILLASAAGVVLGIELTLPDPVFAEPTASPEHFNLASDMVLAGFVTGGFALFYNTAWPQVCLATLPGMAGHGLRFLALEGGCRLEAATFLGGLTVGVVSAGLAWSRRMPVAVLGFAGAVTMIPGLQIYRALGGALQLVRLGERADPGTAVGTLANAFQSGLVVSSLGLGFVLGARSLLALTRRREGKVIP